MLYLPIGVIILRFCKILDSTFFCGLHTFFVWTPQFGWTPRLNYTMLQNEVKLSGFLSKYAEHVVWRRTVLRLRVSASASDGTNPTPFPNQQQAYSRHRPNGLLSKKISHGCETHSGVSHERAPKWLKLETRMADSKEWGFWGGGSQQPPPTSQGGVL